MSKMERIAQRVERIEQELGISADEPIATGTMLEAFAIRRVAREVCREMNVRFEQLMAPQRGDKMLFPARAATAWLARERLNRSYPSIARALSVADHSSVMHQVARAKGMIDRDPAFRQVVDIVSRRLFSRPVQ